MPKLTQKQKRFVDEYLVDLNATQAAIRAGYSEKTAYSIGQRILKNVEIQAAIERSQKEREKRTEITQDRVLQELTKIGFANITDFVEIKEGYVNVKDTSEIPEDKVGAISSIEAGNFGIKLKLNNKLDALEKIGRHLGMFKDNLDQKTAENNLLDQLNESISQIDLDLEIEDDNEI